MMKPNKTIAYVAIIILTFGITGINFENLHFADNVKAYFFLVIGFLILGYYMYRKKQAAEQSRD